MTALVLLEGDWKPDAEVEVTARAASITGARLGLAAGERMRAGDLLTALLARSANDTAIALAEHAAGSVEAFVERMNTRARALHLTATHFVNPAGFDAGGQISSAADLLVLAEEALSHPEFASRVALPSARVVTTKGRAFALSSSNALLGRIPGVDGVKTGYTTRAGKCVVARASRNGHHVVVVLLDARDRWWTVAALIEAAFDTLPSTR